MDRGVDKLKRLLGRKDKGTGAGQEAGSGGGGAANVGVGISAGLDISDPQAGIRALDQAAYLTTTAPVTAASTGEAPGSGQALTSATTGQGGESTMGPEPSESFSGKTWAIVGGVLKMTLSGAVPFIPEPFKGPAVLLSKGIDVFEVSGPHY
jgi:hypothetical protein